MLGVLCGKALSLWKTGATAAVATRHLAREDASRARHRRHRALCAGAVALPCHRARLSRGALLQSRRGQAARPSCGQRAPPCPACASSPRDPREAAVRGADIVTTITTSATPVVLGEWLAPGSHCNAMGQHAPSARELDTQAIRDADVFVDAREQAFAEKGRDPDAARGRRDRTRSMCAASSARSSPGASQAARRRGRAHRVLLRRHGARIHDPVRDADRARRATQG